MKYVVLARTACNGPDYRRSGKHNKATNNKMKRQTLLGQAAIPGGCRVLKLYQGKDDCSIVISGRGELMSTRKHASESALGALPCQLLKNAETASVLIGGLGMGFTLAAVLAETGPQSHVVVAELVPEVVEWNKGPLGSYSGHPLSDTRTSVYQGDVSDLLRDTDQRYDVVALDVDNGPEALSSSGNDWLYSSRGILCARESLNHDGVLAYWSATPDPRFAQRLRECGLTVSEKSIFAHVSKGAKHTIWLASIEVMNLTIQQFSNSAVQQFSSSAVQQFSLH